MKIKYEIEIDNREDMVDMKIALSASDYYCVISEYREWLRRMIKHNENQQQREVLEMASDRFYEILDSYDCYRG